jgi:hypothetical protein
MGSIGVLVLCKPKFLLDFLVSTTLVGLIACGVGGKSSISATGTTSGTNNPSGSLPPTLTGPVSTAVTTGNALAGPTADDLIDAALATIEYQRTAFDPVLARLYNLNANGTAKADGTSLTSLNWDPTHDAALLSGTFGVNTEVIVSNQDNKGAVAPAKGLAVAGETAAKSRYLVMASNPFRTPVNAQMDQFMLNAIQWLTGKPSTTPVKVALVQLDESYWFKDESSTRSWLTAKYGTKVSYNAAKAYDGNNLSKILTDGADLVIVSQRLDTGQDATQIRDGIKALMDAGKPVLYLQLDGGPNALGSLLYDLFQVQYAGDNIWTNYLAAGLDGSTLVGRLSANHSSVRDMLSHMRTGVYSGFTLGAIQSSKPDSDAYLAQFENGAQVVMNMMGAYDVSRTDIFLTPGRELAKLLALIGDRIRQDIVYPLSTANSTPKDFLRAFYADQAVYNYRKIVPAQKDLGTFSREDFSKVTVTTRTVDMISRPNFRATGAYALPGRTFKVTRLDSSAVNTAICVNSLRSGSTQMWDDNSFHGYARPKFLQSRWIPVKPGETIYFTSPYGGPIEVSFNAKDLPVQLKIENIAEHPYWSGTKDDLTFAAKLAANDHDWVEVATDGFEVHSKADRFKSGTLSAPRWNTPALLGAAVMRYTYDFAHVIAGFQGVGIDKDPEVYGWAMGKGLNVSTTDVVKHMNADVPTCGWGCSGNPYDAGWAFDPIGHGDLHELGHSLQSGRWQLKHGAYSYPNHAGTNFYPYYVQSRFFDDTGEHAPGHGMPFKAIFQQLQVAYLGGDRSGTASTAMETYFANVLAGGGDSGIDNSYTFYTQLMMQVRQQGLLQNGWHMMGRIHIVDRAFNAAVKSQATWDAEKAKFGFGQVAFADAQSMSNNDFMVIAMSYTTGLDVRDLLAMWGFRISAFASAQVASFGLPTSERVFFAMKDTQWSDGALTTKVDTFKKITIDGTTPWPLP